MYNHINIKTRTDILDFFNVKEFMFDPDMRVYKLLSQNDQWHFFPSTVEVII